MWLHLHASNEFTFVSSILPSTCWLWPHTSHIKRTRLLCWDKIKARRSAFYLPGGIRCDVSAAAVSLSSQWIISREEERFRVRRAAGSLWCKWVGVRGRMWWKQERMCVGPLTIMCVCWCLWWEHLSGAYLHNVDSFSVSPRASQSFTAMLSIFTHKPLWCQSLLGFIFSYIHHELTGSLSSTSGTFSSFFQLSVLAVLATGSRVQR